MVPRNLLSILIVPLYLMAPLRITAARAQEHPQPEARLQKPWVDLAIYIASGGRQRSRETRAVRQELARAEERLARERRLARAAGIVVDWQQMQCPLPPATQNAALDYAELTRALKERPLDKNVEEAIGRVDRSGSEPADIAVVEKTLAERKDVLDLLRHATDKRKCVFRRDWSLGPDVTFPEYVQMRRAMRLLQANGLFLARTGHMAAAVSELSRGFRLAAHATSDRVLIGLLVGIAIEGITLAGLEEILEECGPNPDIAGRVRQAIVECAPHYTLSGALRTEAVMPDVICSRLGRAQTFERLVVLTPSYGAEEGNTAASSSHGPAPGRKPYPGEAQAIRQIFDAVRARHLSLLRRLVTMADETPLNRLAKQKKEARFNPTDDMIGRLVSAFDLNFAEFATTLLRIQAKEQVLLAAAGLLTYRATHAAFPAVLQAAFVTPPNDPFTAAPLRYRLEADGFVVYSVGETGEFDGGTAGMKRASREAYFRYPRHR